MAQTAHNTINKRLALHQNRTDGHDGRTLLIRSNYTDPLIKRTISTLRNSLTMVKFEMSWCAVVLFTSNTIKLGYSDKTTRKQGDQIGVKQLVHQGTLFGSFTQL